MAGSMLLWTSSAVKVLLSLIIDDKNMIGVMECEVHDVRMKNKKSSAKINENNLMAGSQKCGSRVGRHHKLIAA
jgi:hypothetical protein